MKVAHDRVDSRAMTYRAVSERKEAINMKRIGLWAIGMAAMISVGLITVKPGYADEKHHPEKCTLDTLKGQYLGASSGTLFPPAFGVTKPSVSTVAGYSIYNGDGTGEDFVTFSINGVIVVGLVPSPVPTTYTLNSNCTGTKTVLPSGPHFNIFVALDGEEETHIATDPGFASSVSNRRVGSE
jgi:hypothetical protein